MRAGRLDRRITIQQATAGQDAAGGPTGTWSDWATVWAVASNLKGREFFAARQEMAEQAIRFAIRWRSGVTRAMRVVYEGDTYDIEAIEEIPRRQALMLYCKARVT